MYSLQQLNKNRKKYINRNNYAKLLTQSNNKRKNIENAYAYSKWLYMSYLLHGVRK